MLFRPFAFISLKVLLLASSGALSLPLGQFSRSLLTYDVAIRVSSTSPLNRAAMLTISFQKRGVDSLLITRSTPSSSATGGGKRVRIEDLVNKEEIDPISQKLKLGETTPVSVSVLGHVFPSYLSAQTPQTPDPSKPSFSGYVNLKAQVSLAIVLKFCLRSAHISPSNCDLQFISYNVDAPLYCPLSNCPQPPGTQFADAISRYSHLSFEHKKEDPILCLEGCGTMIWSVPYALFAASAFSLTMILSPICSPASMRNHVYQVCSRVDRVSQLGLDVLPIGAE